MINYPIVNIPGKFLDVGKQYDAILTRIQMPRGSHLLFTGMFIGGIQAPFAYDRKQMKLYQFTTALDTFFIKL